MQAHMKEYAVHLEERAEQIRDGLYWWEKMEIRIRGRKDDGAFVDETAELYKRERESLKMYEALREKLRAEYMV